MRGMKIEERLDPETLRLLRGVLEHHPEFLDIWAAHERGEPDGMDELDMSLNVRSSRTREDDE